MNLQFNNSLTTSDLIPFQIMIFIRVFIFAGSLHICPGLYQGNKTSFDTISDLFNLFELFQIYLNV